MSNKQMEDEFNEDNEPDTSELDSRFDDIDSSQVNNSYTKFYWIVPEMFEISVIKTMLMIKIYDLSKKTGYCYASKDHLAKLLRVSRQTIHNHLKSLRFQYDFIRFGPLYKGVRQIKPSYKWHQLMEIIGLKFGEDNPYRKY